MIEATPEDQEAIEAFLTSRITTSMFQLSNLRRYGMAGGHPRAMRFWLSFRDGKITDALGVSQEGMVFPQCPSGPWGEAAVVLAGQTVKGMLGEAGQVAVLRRFLQLNPDAKALDTVDPLFTLPLSDLVLPDIAGFALIPIGATHRDIAVSWRRAYIEEVMPIPGEDPQTKAEADIAMYMQGESHRILLSDGAPVAMTGFNAVMDEAVQIGGVYTPPDLRCRGYARRAVAMHLREARVKGAQMSVLFAASDNASRAYEAVGFRRAGDYAVLVYETPQVPCG
ncbi:GNAT family N-acetyltransferase [Yoonia litorea]|uniref:Acetyltransferase (GNAT) family protein n=1 Tax=Yoonia litorea TaxID=1123755 RepID=A0A1I6L2X5_9RHOB|nr:GNAT family N-acetyltransferase [Yoonia litorea]SFR97819.1 Acetyltransferase (GNAT) family protein [Yoonia litorea]